MAITLDEQIVGLVEVQSGCAQTVELPPPSSCSPFVHSLYSMSQWHAFTIMIVLLFLLLLFEAILYSFSRGGGH